ncbi:MAG: hypothetical protein IJ555_08520 [Ruminococcus sp.]|nr:hypothetical protein [Ruminococcus sp.]MBR1749323.1 hypothetical protein [Ruminococcus sp.]
MKALELIAALALIVYAVLYWRQERAYYTRIYLIPLSKDTVETIFHNYCDKERNLYLDLRGDKLIVSGDYRIGCSFCLRLYDEGQKTRAILSEDGVISGNKGKFYYFTMVNKVFENLGAEEITGA